MRSLPDSFIQLIYADPPFFTQRDFKHLYVQKEGPEFKDVWELGLDGYLSWLRPRLVEMRRLLSDNGSIYLHLDWHASHYAKVMMDRVFGSRNFLNEIIWHYKDPAGTVKDRFKKKHDTILLYSKNSGKHIFNMDAVRMEYSSGTIKQGIGGVISFGRPTKLHSLGKVPEDVWDIPIINSQAKERLGYPTQKPERLLQTMVKASSSAGDIVADFFCGSGTTPYVAQSLGRRWIAADINGGAIRTTLHRLRDKSLRKDRHAINLLTCGIANLSGTKETEEDLVNICATTLGIDSDESSFKRSSGMLELRIPGKEMILRLAVRSLTPKNDEEIFNRTLVVEEVHSTERSNDSWEFTCPLAEHDSAFEKKPGHSRCLDIKMPVAALSEVRKGEDGTSLHIELWPMGEGIPESVIVRISPAGRSGRSQVKRLRPEEIASGSCLLPLRLRGEVATKIIVLDSNGGRSVIHRLLTV